MKKFTLAFFVLLYGLFNGNIATGQSTQVYSQSFTSGGTSASQCTAWNTFCSNINLGFNYTSVQISGSGSATATGAVATAIVTALKNNTAYGPTLSGGYYWFVGTTGECYASGTEGKELGACATSTTQCNCGTNCYDIRPCIGNDNWGGATGGVDCGAATQTMTVTLTYTTPACYNTTGGYGTYWGQTIAPSCASQSTPGTSGLASTMYTYWAATAGVEYSFSLSASGWTGLDMTIYNYNGSSWVPLVNGAGSLNVTPSSANLANSGNLLVALYNGTACPPTASSSSAILTYQITTPYIPSISESVSSVCNGSGVTYTAGGSGVGSFYSFEYEWNNAGGFSGAWGTTNPYTWTSGLNGASVLDVRAATVNGGCYSYSSDVAVQVYAATVAGTLTQAPASGGHQCTGSAVTYSLSGANGTPVSYYSWSENGTGTGWNDWTGGFVSSWTCGINGVYNQLQVYAAVTNGACATVNTNTVIITVDPASVAGTLSQAPASGGQQCTGSAVTYTLSGYTGTPVSYYTWSEGGTGTGWNDWTGGFVSSWNCSINGVYNQLQVYNVVTSGVCPSANSNTVIITVNPASSTGSWVTSPLYACYNNGTTYNASGVATSQSITGYVGTITGWGYGSSGTCTSDEVSYPDAAGSATSPYPCCFDAPSDATYMMVAVTSGACPTAYMCMSPIYNTLTNPTSATVTGSISGNSGGCQSAGNITLACSGGNLGAMAGGYYQWYSGSCGGTAVGTGASLTIAAPAATTNYYVAAQDKCGANTACYGPITYTVTPTASVASVSGTSPICLGSSTTYTTGTVVLGGGTGAWSSSNTAIATVSSSGVVTGVSSGTCNIVYTVTGGCNGTPSASQPLTVTALPVVSITGPTTFCTNATTTLAPTTLGTWVSNNTSVATVSGYTVTGAAAGGTTNFTFTTTAGPNCSNTTGNVVVTALPVQYGVTGGGTYCLGSTSTVGLSNSQVGVTYTLYLNNVSTGVTLAGTGAAISFNNLTATGTYTIYGTTNTNSCVQQMTGSAVVSELSPNITNNPGATGVGTNGCTLNGTD